MIAPLCSYCSQRVGRYRLGDEDRYCCSMCFRTRPIGVQRRLVRNDDHRLSNKQSMVVAVVVGASLALYVLGLVLVAGLR